MAASSQQNTGGARPAPVLVLAGGLSHERDVSLRSGRRVAEAMRGAGLEVVERDADTALLALLREERPSCVVPMLHGETGEDGAIREVLELFDVPYVGARPAACRVAFDKPVAKTVATRAGLLTPESVCLPAQTFRELGASEVMAALVARLGLPLMVKPTQSGSALGAAVVRTAEELPAAMVGAFAYGDVALIEQFVVGREVAVPVIDDGSGPRALPAVLISPDGGVYDYTARYTAGATEFTVPAPLSPELTEEVARVALTAHTALGLRDVSRSDLIIDGDGRVWFLEVNSAPGFTETSTVPLAISAAGLDLGKVCASLVQAALARPTSPEAAPGPVAG
ncbi:D-alanine--D-alanine ligase family protein [Nocardioides ferulae]|uniref:D-alanine--D-alanine ligase family protein n=1 Tax=Nocardioides ferulae TaxID=2340821 RepID=UPI000EB5072B|nr:D-alanine--D-alanine ligase [Nocardioides ferulae]